MNKFGDDSLIWPLCLLKGGKKTTSRGCHRTSTSPKQRRNFYLASLAKGRKDLRVFTNQIGLRDSANELVAFRKPFWPRLETLNEYFFSDDSACLLSSGCFSANAVRGERVHRRPGRAGPAFSLSCLCLASVWYWVVSCHLRSWQSCAVLPRNRLLFPVMRVIG